jgi:hypothetical protein
MTETTKAVRRAMADLTAFVGVALIIIGVVLALAPVDQQCGGVFHGKLLAPAGCSTLVGERLPFVWGPIILGAFLLIYAIVAFATSAPPPPAPPTLARHAAPASPPPDSPA